MAVNKLKCGDLTGLRPFLDTIMLEDSNKNKKLPKSHLFTRKLTSVLDRISGKFDNLGPKVSFAF